MKAKNQIVIISGILALLATAIIAANYSVQTVKADKNTNPFGNLVSGIAKSEPGGLCVASKTCDTNGAGHNPGGGNSFGKDIVAGANPNK